MQFCWCFDLRRGVQVMAVSLILVHLLIFVVSVVKLEDTRAAADPANDTRTHHRTRPQHDGRRNRRDRDSGLSGSYLGTLLILGFWTAVEVVTDVVLVAGTVKRNKWLLLPWLVFKTATMLMLFVGLLGLGVMVIFHKQALEEDSALTDVYHAVAVGLVVLVLLVIWWLGVFFLFRSFARSEVQPFRLEGLDLDHSNDFKRFGGELPPAYSEKPRTGERHITGQRAPLDGEDTLHCHRVPYGTGPLDRPIGPRRALLDSQSSEPEQFYLDPHVAAYA